MSVLCVDDEHTVIGGRHPLYLYFLSRMTFKHKVAPQMYSRVDIIAAMVDPSPRCLTFDQCKANTSELSI